jgi:hypothetical protein
MMNYKSSKDLLLEIARCKQRPNRNMDCSEIFKYQEMNGISELAPVPWQGHLETAKILFVGSNPSEIDNGILATNNWLDNEIFDFYEHRFDQRNDNAQNKWTANGTNYLLKSGKQSAKQVPYWRVIKNNWAPQIIAKYSKDGDATPGTDYALTEIVHCYSKKEKGVKQCKKLCSDLYFENILKFAKNVKTIVIMGKHATPIMNEYFNRHELIIGEKKELDWHPLVDIYKNGTQVLKKLPGLIKGNIDGRDLIFIALPHPGAFQYPTLLNLYLTDDEMNNL